MPKITNNPININDQFGDWVVLSYGPTYKTHQTFICRCKCGSKQTIVDTNLKSGRTTRCVDCYNKALQGKNFKHGKRAEYKGKTIKALGLDQSFEKWAIFLGLSEDRLEELLKKGLSIEAVKALKG